MIELDSMFKFGESVINRLFPDQNARADQMRKLEEMRQKGDLDRMRMNIDLMLAQIEVNKEQAKSKSFFVSGARPFAIWAGVASMVYSGILKPFLDYIWVYLQATGYISADVAPPPTLETSALFVLTSGLLGVSTMRSYDKKNGVETNKIK